MACGTRGLREAWALQLGTLPLLALGLPHRPLAVAVWSPFQALQGRRLPAQAQVPTPVALLCAVVSALLAIGRACAQSVGQRPGDPVPLGLAVARSASRLPFVLVLWLLRWGPEAPASSPSHSCPPAVRPSALSPPPLYRLCTCIGACLCLDSPSSTPQASGATQPLGVVKR